MVISSCQLKTTSGPKYALEAISEGLKFKNFMGGMPPDPLEDALLRAIPLPPLPPPPSQFSLSIILPPCPFF